LLARYDRIRLIPGTSSVSHLEENIAPIKLELDDADLAVLDRVGQRDDGAEGGPGVAGGVVSCAAQRLAASLSRLLPRP
jgi:diketogulonate reductase-like aldo/keto reductase